MLEINVIRKIDIKPISQDWLEEVVRKALLEQLPEGAVIDGVEFQMKRNPSGVQVVVDARFGDEPKSTVLDKVVEPAKELFTSEPVEEEVEEEVEVKEEPRVETPSVANIFANS